MAGANRIGGLAGVTALFVLALASVSWLWARLQLQMDGDFFLTGVFAPLMVTVAGAHWLARPHIFGWILFLGLLLFLEAAPRGRAVFPGMFAVTALWANLHASFILAPVLCLLYAAAHALRPLLWETDAREDRAKASRFLQLSLAALAGKALITSRHGMAASRNVSLI